MSTSRSFVVIAMAYLLVIIAGALLLWMDVSLAAGRSLPFREALLTATSGVCLVGLHTQDLAVHLSGLGKLIIFALMQAGALLALLFGARLLTSAYQDEPPALQSLLVRVVSLMAGAQLLGALLLGTFLGQDGVLLAMEAFCNTGMGVSSIDLTEHRDSPAVYLILTLLSLAGMFGWTYMVKGRGRNSCRLAMSTLAWMYVVGVLIILAGQLMPHVNNWLGHNVTANQQALGPLTAAESGRHLADASFLVLTSRTTGLTAMPLEDLRPAGQFTMVLLMFIGGGAGGVVGGVRLGGLAILVLALLSYARGRDKSKIYGQSIPGALLRWAVVLFAFQVCLIIATTLLLSLTEPFPFLKLLFEATSASSLSGLSLGITSHLSAQGKYVLVGAMWLGRIAPMGIALCGLAQLRQITNHQTA